MRRGGRTWLLALAVVGAGCGGGEAASAAVCRRWETTELCLRPAGSSQLAVTGTGFAAGSEVQMYESIGLRSSVWSAGDDGRLPELFVARDVGQAQDLAFNGRSPTGMAVVFTATVCPIRPMAGCEPSFRAAGGERRDEIRQIPPPS